MSGAMWLGAVLLPPLLAGIGSVVLRGRVMWLMPIAAAPAPLVAAMAPAGVGLRLDWLLLGTGLALDETGRVYLAITGLLWLAAGWHAMSYLREDPQRSRFTAFFCVTMLGNLGALISADLAGFLLFYAVMSFAAYGLVVHRGDAEARRAGRVYIALALASEVLVLTGILLVADSGTVPGFGHARAHFAASPGSLAVALLVVGLGVKLGMVPVHVWLPLAHPVAPAPASAVLSGAMIKVGLLGLLRVLPLGSASLPGWGGVLLGLGLTATVYGALIGIGQSRPKTVLAYSSVSQMGFVLSAIGVSLLQPAIWTKMGTALGLFTAHHAMAKAALFLAAGTRLPRAGTARVWALLLLVIPALAIAGLPLTSGALAKSGLKAAAQLSASQEVALVTLAWAIAATGSTLLMARFLVLQLRAESGQASQAPASPWMPVALLAIGGLALPWLALAQGWAPAGYAWGGSLAKAWSLVWPLATGALIAGSAWHWTSRGRHPRRAFSVPAGDLWVLAERTGKPLLRAGILAQTALTEARRRAHVLQARTLDGVEQVLGQAARLEVTVVGWRTAAAAVIALTLLGGWLTAG